MTRRGANRRVVGVGDGAEVGKHFVDPGFGGFGGVGLEGGVLQVGAGGLQGIEDQSGLALGDAGVNEGVDGFHESDLDGIGVLEDGQVEALVASDERLGALFRGTAPFAGFVVEVAEATVLESGRAAGLSVDLDVFTEWYRGHDPSPYPRFFGIRELGWK